MNKLLITMLLPAWALVAKNSLVAFLAPIIPIYLLFLMLVVVDLRLGIQAACKRGEIIRRSRALRRTISKLIDYCAIVTTCRMFDTYIISAYSIPLVFATFCLLMAWVELDSIFSNYGEINGINLLHSLKQYLADKLSIELPSNKQQKDDK